LGRVTLAALLVASPVAFTCAVAKDLKAIFACDANGKALYANLFVFALKPAEKDGKGKITKLSLTGKVLED
jgi:hypothetical protein